MTSPGKTLLLLALAGGLGACTTPVSDWSEDKTPPPLYFEGSAPPAGRGGPRNMTYWWKQLDEFEEAEEMEEEPVEPIPPEDEPAMEPAAAAAAGAAAATAADADADLMAPPVQTDEIYYAVMFSPGPNYPESGDFSMVDCREAHLDFLDRIQSDGTLVMAGPYLDGEGGMSVYRADSMDAARGIAEQDPCVQAGVLSIEVREWYVGMTGSE